MVKGESSSCVDKHIHGALVFLSFLSPCSIVGFCFLLCIQA